MSDTQASTPKKRRSPASGRKTDPQTIEARNKAADAMRLRMEGLTFEEIAEQAGYNSKQAAWDAVRRSLKEIIREPAEELIRLDLERLDVLWQIQYLRAQGGDVEALGACLRLMERRARMLGLDAPSKSSGTVEMIGAAGVLVTPATMTPEQWDEAAKAQQAALTTENVQ